MSPSAEVSLQSVLYELPLRSLEKLLASIESLRIPQDVRLSLLTGDCSAVSCVPDDFFATWSTRLGKRGIEWRHTFFNANVGFGAGQNLLASQAPEAAAYLAINPDALAPFHLLERLWAFACQQSDWGIVEARQIPLEHPKFVDPASGRTDWASGCCALYRGEAFRQLGGFDEAFFLYGEDVDISWRMRGDGFGVYCCLDTCVYHAKRLGRQGPIASTTEIEQGTLAAHLLKAKYQKGYEPQPLETKGDDRHCRAVAKAQDILFRSHAALLGDASTGARKVATFKADGTLAQHRWQYAEQAAALDAIPDDSTHDRKISVIVRTAGGREELLIEALLSIYAQRHAHYEVILTVHNAPIAGVQSMVDSFPREFSSRVSVLPVKGGGRSRPLNVGLERAAGDYVCFLDDDDLFFDHHLSAASAMDSAIYQTFAARRWVNVQRESSTFPYTCEEIQPYYIEPYSLVTQLNENVVPICNMLLPMEAVRRLELRFDESYEVREDWKFLMDAARELPVRTLATVTTAIAVRTNASNTLSDPAYVSQWEANRDRLVEDLARSHWNLSESEAHELAQEPGLQAFSKARLSPEEMRELIERSKPVYEERQKLKDAGPSFAYRSLRAVLTPVWSLRHRLPQPWQDSIKRKLLKERRKL